VLVGGGVQGHKINPDNFVRNYVTAIRDTFTAWKKYKHLSDIGDKKQNLHLSVYILEVKRS